MVILYESLREKSNEITEKAPARLFNAVYN